MCGHDKPYKWLWEADEFENVQKSATELVSNKLFLSLSEAADILC